MLERQPPDPLLSLIALHRADPRPDTIDVGVGVYRDADGRTPVMAAVKEAERRLLADQTTKAYLGPEGDARFTELLAQIALGADLAASLRLTGVQTPGGTGALRLAAETIARANGQATIWIGTPSWPIHAPIFREAGLKVATYRHADMALGQVDRVALNDAFDRMAPRDVLLLHGCCHNPTGIDLSEDDWRHVAARLTERGAMPLIDLAYQGLGRDLESDVAGLRTIAGAVPELLLAYSCDKNFGLYRERTGALWGMTADADQVPALRDTMLVLARSLWSMPPDHGAAVVRLILEHPPLRAMWVEELASMCARLRGLRKHLAATNNRLSSLAEQNGLFALLPISDDAVARLRRNSGIYLADGGRINVAGLSDTSVERFAAVLSTELNQDVSGRP